MANKKAANCVIAGLLAVIMVFGTIAPVIPVRASRVDNGESHTHTFACYEDYWVDCEIQDPEHQHDESCYAHSGDLVCGLEEGEYHTHNEDPFQCEVVASVLTCGKVSHTHSKECELANASIDEENQDGDSQINESNYENIEPDEANVYICGRAEHIHSSDCYQQVRRCRAIPTAEPISTNAVFTPSVKVDVVASNKEDSFTLVIEAKGNSDSVAMPETRTTVVSGSGVAQFASIGFTVAGTYEFEITQNITNENYRQDNRVWTLTVQVTEKDGELITSGTYSLPDGTTNNNNAAFINVYLNPKIWSAKTVQDAQKIMDNMTLAEKVGQLFLVHYPEDGAGTLVQAKTLIDKYHPGGYLVFAPMFENSTPSAVRQKITETQAAAKIPMLFTVDEEGGTVTRISKFSQYGHTNFQSPQELKANGGLSAVAADAVDKAEFLKNLGLNVNHAPVADVAGSSGMMYKRTWGGDGLENAEYVETYVKASEAAGMPTTLKHFPGYGGTSSDTHNGFAVNDLAWDDFAYNDLLPFYAGIAAGSNAVMVTHNTINCLDTENPASLSPAVYNLLRDEMGFDGIVMTDDLSMGAITKFVGSGQASLRALQAGADMAMTATPDKDIPVVLAAARDGSFPVADIEEKCLRILCWKAEMGLLDEQPSNTAEAEYTSEDGTVKQDGTFTEIWTMATGENGASGTIKLLSDASFSKSLSLSANPSKEIRLDLNGFSLSYTGTGDGITVSGGNTLSIDDSTHSVKALSSGKIGYNPNTMELGYTRWEKGGSDQYPHQVAKYVGFGNLGSFNSEGAVTLIRLDQGTFKLYGGLLENENGDHAVSSHANGNNYIEVHGGAIVNSGNSENNGGGIKIRTGVITMDGGYIAGNKAYDGGGIFDQDAASTLPLSGGVIASNYSYHYGGGVYSCYNSKWIRFVDDIIVSGNIAEGKGGGAYLQGVGLQTWGCPCICDNTAAAGGGIYCDSWGSVNIAGDTIISGNRAILSDTGSSKNGCGGGIYNNIEDSQWGITSFRESAIVYGNTAETLGGGVCSTKNNQYAADLNDTKDISVIIAGNTVNGKASNLYLYATQTVKLSCSSVHANINVYAESLDKKITVVNTDSSMAQNAFSCFTADRAGYATLAEENRIVFVEKEISGEAEATYTLDNAASAISGSFLDMWEKANESGGTVALLKNISFAEELLVSEGKTITLQLNGYTLAYTGTGNAVTVPTGATLNIRDAVGTVSKKTLTGDVQEGYFPGEKRVIYKLYSAKTVTISGQSYPDYSGDNPLVPYYDEYDFGKLGVFHGENANSLVFLGGGNFSLSNGLLENIGGQHGILTDNQRSNRINISGGVIANSGTLEGNSNGGGICCLGGNIQTSNMHIVGNKAGGDGAGVYWSVGENYVDLLRDSFVAYNESGANGGGVYLSKTYPNGANNIREAYFINNTAAKNGGAIYGNMPQLVMFDNNYIGGNRAANGGGVYMLATSNQGWGYFDTSVNPAGKSIIAHNTAREAGGGIYATCGKNAKVNLRLHEFVCVMNNSAEAQAGGVYIADKGFLRIGGDVQVRNNTVAADGTAPDIYLPTGAQFDFVADSKPEIYDSTELPKKMDVRIYTEDNSSDAIVITNSGGKTLTDTDAYKVIPSRPGYRSIVSSNQIVFVRGEFEGMEASCTFQNSTEYHVGSIAQMFEVASTSTSDNKATIHVLESCDLKKDVTVAANANIALDLAGSTVTYTGTGNAITIEAGGQFELTDTRGAIVQTDGGTPGYYSSEKKVVYELWGTDTFKFNDNYYPDYRPDNPLQSYTKTYEFGSLGVFHGEGAESLISLQGGSFTMTNGLLENINGKHAVITSTSGSNYIRINDGVIANSGVTSENTDGGGISCNGGGINFNGGHVIGNQAGNEGGGISVRFANFAKWSWVSDGYIAYNSAKVNGGGVSIVNSPDVGFITHILNNTAGKNGGGIYGYNTKMWIAGGSNICGNTASNGGGLFTTGKDTEDKTSINSQAIIAYNSAINPDGSEGAGIGGGIAVGLKMPSVTNCAQTFKMYEFPCVMYNTADSMAGGIYVSTSGPIEVGGLLQVRNNTTKGIGADLYLPLGLTLTLNNRGIEDVLNASKAQMNIGIYTEDEKRIVPVVAPTDGAALNVADIGKFTPLREGYQRYLLGERIVFARRQDVSIPVMVMQDGEIQQIATASGIYRSEDGERQFILINEIAPMLEPYGFDISTYDGSFCFGIQSSPDDPIDVFGEPAEKIEYNWAIENSWQLPIPASADLSQIKILYLPNSPFAGELQLEDVLSRHSFWTVQVRDLYSLAFPEAENCSSRQYVAAGKSCSLSLPYREEPWNWQINGYTDRDFTYEEVKENETLNINLRNIHAKAVITSGIEGGVSYTVQYYANVRNAKVFEQLQDEYPTLPVIDTAATDSTGAKLPVNGTQNLKIKYLAVDTKNGGTVVKQSKPTAIYSDTVVNFNIVPTIQRADKLRENTNYDLTELWLLKENRDPASGNRDDWTIYTKNGSGVSSIHDLKLSTNPDDAGKEGTIFITDDSVIRLVYEPNESTVNTPVQFYDYDISDGSRHTNGSIEYLNSKDGQGINNHENYTSRGYESTQAKFAFGNANTKTGLEGQIFKRDEKDNSLNGYNRSGGSYRGCTFGLTQGLDPVSGNLIYANSVCAPALFADGDAIGKTPISGYEMQWERYGDTYTLAAIPGTVATNLTKFNNPKCGDMAPYTHIWTNNFWPMDSADTFGAPGHDIKFGDVYKQDNRLIYQAGKAAPPVSDDGLDHNAYFGMQFSINFRIPADYTGDLEYIFFGDDDMWGFLDGKLVLDIGGVHSSVGEYVNLWDYIEPGDTSSHTLTFYYMERGASGSTCWMHFTIPSASMHAEPITGETLRVSKTVEGTVTNPDNGFKFDITLLDNEDLPPARNFEYFLYDKNGGFLVGGVLKNGKGTISLADGQYAEIVNIYPGTHYTVTEAKYNCITEIAVNGEKKTAGTSVSGVIPNGASVVLGFTNSFKKTEVGSINILPKTGSCGLYPIYIMATILLVGAISITICLRRSRKS